MVGHSQLYHYFDSRDHLVRAVVDSTIDAVLGHSSAMSDEPTRLADAIMAALQGGLLLAQIRRDPNQLRHAFDGARAALDDAA